MSFESNEYHLTISISDAGSDRIDEYIEKRRAADDSFTYTAFQSSDSTSYYKITRGNNMWSAYDLYMLKQIEGNRYIIQLSSDIIGRNELIDIVKHVYSSMKQCTQAEE